MNTHGPGVWITGPSRSGTSMIAGIFHEHDVFFGRTVAGDEHNEKGYFEHPCLIDRVDCGIMANWPDAWWKTLKAEGFNGSGWWGVKRGPRSWPWVRLLFPELIIFCKRPRDQILRSRARRWPRRSTDHHAFSIDQANRLLRKISQEASCQIVTVNTSSVIAGDYRRLNKAFQTLGLWLDTERVDAWVDRSLWNRGPEK